MNDRLKKLLAVILCVGMLGCSILPANAAAVKWNGEITADPDAGDTITLNGNVSIPETAYVFVSNNTISLNKHELIVKGTLQDFENQTKVNGGTIHNYGTCSGLVLAKDVILNNYGICSDISGEGQVIDKLGGKITIASSGKRGDKLTAISDFCGIDTTTLVYQWQRGDSENGDFSNISGATKDSYQLTADDCGKYVRVKVTDGAEKDAREGSVVSDACKVAKNTAVLNASNITIGKGESKNLTATLKDTEGTALSGRKISLILGEKTYTAVTDSSGIATFQASDTGIAKLDAQTYSLEYIFAGDASTEALSEPVTATLSVELKAHSITAKKASHGTISASEKSAKEGDIISVKVEPDEGYELKTLKVNGETIEEESFEMPNEAVTLTASFTKIKCKIQASVSPQKSGTVKGAKTVEYGKSITLTATANSGYKFSKWTENGKTVSTSATWKIDKVTASHTYKAEFVKAAATTGGTASGLTTSSVQTGDSSPIVLLVILAAAAVFGMGISFRRLRRKDS